MNHDWYDISVHIEHIVWKCRNCESIITRDAVPEPDALIHPPLNLETGRRDGPGRTCGEMIAKRVHDA